MHKKQVDNLIVLGKVHGNSEVNLKSGMCFVLYSDTAVEYYPDRNDPWSYLWIDIDGEGVEKLLAKSGFSTDRPYRSMRHWHLRNLPIT